ncbi:regulator of chromosome condensation 1/beta-lactamase-inhibitor protein II [Cladochytrium replicatum]|nr:regulator of chromosome condensation 1/beta-lactamase-inhibitor protein II [Cladochytrium replicatum]
MPRPLSRRTKTAAAAAASSAPAAPRRRGRPPASSQAEPTTTSRVSKRSTKEAKEVEEAPKKAPARRPREPKADAQPFTVAPKYTEVGEVFGLGSGDCGQLGLGPDVLEKEKPAKIDYFANKDIVAVFAGGLHNIALSASGKLYSWGCNDQLALGRSGEETLPAPVEGLEDEVIVDVACGDSISVALTSHGQVYAWGTFRKSTGNFGFRPDINEQRTPLLIEELKNVVQISAGANHIGCTTSDSKVYTWGTNEQRQLGRRVVDRHLKEMSLIPRPINFRPPKTNGKFSRVYCGSYHTFVVHDTAGVFAFGLNNHGQLGVGDTEEHEDPLQVEDLKEREDEDVEMKVGVISAGQHHSMLLTAKGEVYTWGRGDSGQLGHGDNESKSTPQHVKTLDQHISSISAGSYFSLALHSDPLPPAAPSKTQLYGWGYGEMGQLANGSQDEQEPTEFDLKGRVVLCSSAGGQHVVMLLRWKDEDTRKKAVENAVKMDEEVKKKAAEKKAENGNEDENDDEDEEEDKEGKEGGNGDKMET